MPQLVQFEGTPEVLEFPDDASRQEIAEFLNRRYPPPPPRPGGFFEALGNAAQRGWAFQKLGAEIEQPQPRAEAVAEAQGRILANPPSARLEEIGQAPTWLDVGRALFTEPGRTLPALAEMAVESQVSYLPTLARKLPARLGIGAAAGAGVGALAGGGGALPGVLLGLEAGFSEAVGSSSYALEYAGKFLQSLAEAGVDVSNAESLQAGLADPQKVQQARNLAQRKALPIAAFDTLGALLLRRIAFTRPAAGMGRLGQVGRVGAGLGLEAGMGMAGETAGEVAAGEPLQPGAIASEGLVEAFTSGPEFVSAAGLRRAHRKAGLSRRPLPEVPESEEPDAVQERSATAPAVGQAPGVGPEMEPSIRGAVERFAAAQTRPEEAPPPAAVARARPEPVPRPAPAPAPSLPPLTRAPATTAEVLAPVIAVVGPQPQPQPISPDVTPKTAETPSPLPPGTGAVAGPRVSAEPDVRTAAPVAAQSQAAPIIEQGISPAPAPATPNVKQPSEATAPLAIPPTAEPDAGPTPSQKAAESGTGGLTEPDFVTLSPGEMHAQALRVAEIKLARATELTTNQRRELMLQSPAVKLILADDITYASPLTKRTFRRMLARAQTLAESQSQPIVGGVAPSPETTAGTQEEMGAAPFSPAGAIAGVTDQDRSGFGGGAKPEIAPTAGSVVAPSPAFASDAEVAELLNAIPARTKAMKLAPFFAYGPENKPDDLHDHARLHGEKVQLSRRLTAVQDPDGSVWLLGTAKNAKTGQVELANPRFRQKDEPEVISFEQLLGRGFKVTHSKMDKLLPRTRRVHLSAEQWAGLLQQAEAQHGIGEGPKAPLVKKQPKLVSEKALLLDENEEELAEQRRIEEAKAAAMRKAAENKEAPEGREFGYADGAVLWDYLSGYFGALPEMGITPKAFEKALAGMAGSPRVNALRSAFLTAMRAVAATGDYSAEQSAELTKDFLYEDFSRTRGGGESAFAESLLARFNPEAAEVAERAGAAQPGGSQTPSPATETAGADQAEVRQAPGAVFGPAVIRPPINPADNIIDAERVPNERVARVRTFLRGYSLEPNNKYRDLAAALLGNGDAAGLSVDVELSDTISSYYDPRRDVIVLRRSLADEDGNVERYNAIHEIVHALTYHKIPAEVRAMSAEQLAAAIRDGRLTGPLQALAEAYLMARQSMPEAYGSQNLDEFLAEAFSNDQFQKGLNEIQMPGTPRTLWQKFVDAIRTLLGLAVQLGSALDTAIRSGAELMASARTSKGTGEKVFSRIATPGALARERELNEFTGPDRAKGVEWNAFIPAWSILGRALGHLTSLPEGVLKRLKPLTDLRQVMEASSMRLGDLGETAPTNETLVQMVDRLKVTRPELAGAILNDFQMQSIGLSLLEQKLLAGLDEAQRALTESQAQDSEEGTGPSERTANRQTALAEAQQALAVHRAVLQDDWHRQNRAAAERLTGSRYQIVPQAEGEQWATGTGGQVEQPLTHRWDVANPLNPAEQVSLEMGTSQKNHRAFMAGLRQAVEWWGAAAANEQLDPALRNYYRNQAQQWHEYWLAESLGAGEGNLRRSWFSPFSWVRHLTRWFTGGYMAITRLDAPWWLGGRYGAELMRTVQDAAMVQDRLQRALWRQDGQKLVYRPVELIELEHAAARSHGFKTIQEWVDHVANGILWSHESEHNVQLRQGVPFQGALVTAQDMKAVKAMRDLYAALAGGVAGMKQLHEAVLIEDEVAGVKVLRQTVPRAPLTIRRVLTREALRFAHELTQAPLAQQTALLEKNFEAVLSHLWGMQDTGYRSFLNSPLWRDYLEARRRIDIGASRGGVAKPANWGELVALLTTVQNERAAQANDPEHLPALEAGQVAGIYTGELLKGAKALVAEEQAVGLDKPDVTVHAVENFMNRPRQSRLLPPGFYQYAMADESQIRETAGAISRVFTQRNRTALNKTIDMLDAQIADWQKGGTDQQTSAVEQQRGENLLNLEDAVALRHELDQQRRSLNEFDVAEATVEGKALLALRTAIGASVGNVLLGPAVLTRNMISPALEAFRESLARGGQVGWLSRLLGRNVQTGLMAKQAKLFANNVVATAVAAVKARPNEFSKDFVDALAEHRGLLEEVAAEHAGVMAKWAAERQRAEQLGLLRRWSLRQELKAAQTLWMYAGGYADAKEPVDLSPWSAKGIWRRLASAARLTAGVQAKVMTAAENFSNGLARVQAQDLLSGLEVRAMELGRAWKAGGGPPNAETAVLTAEQLLGRGASAKQAAVLRRRFLAAGLVNLDRAMIEFVRRRQAGQEVGLLSDVQEDRLIYALAQEINKAGFGSRPIAFQAGHWRRFAGSILGWPFWQNESLMRAMATWAKDGSLKRFGQSWSTVLQYMFWATAIGVAVAPFTDWLTEIFWRQKTSRLKLSQAENAGDFALRAVLAASPFWPMAGGLVRNMMTEPGGTRARGIGGTGFSLYPMEVLNSAMQVFGYGSTTGDWKYPVIDFLARWAPNSKIILSRVPSMAGEVSRRQVRATIMANRSSDMPSPRIGGAPVASYLSADLRQTANWLAEGNLEGALLARQEGVAKIMAEKKVDYATATASFDANIAAKNPWQSALGRMPTAQERALVLSRMEPAEQRQLLELEGRFNAYASATGHKEREFVRQERRTGSGGGQGGGGGFGQAPLLMGEASHSRAGGTRQAAAGASSMGGAELGGGGRVQAPRVGTGPAARSFRGRGRLAAGGTVRLGKPRSRFRRPLPASVNAPVRVGHGAKTLKGRGRKGRRLRRKLPKSGHGH